MGSQRYTVTQHPVQTLLTWARSGEIAIPEIQRPFVWDSTKVRNLLDSLYKGYPVGYLIAWRNPSIKLKDGTSSAGKRILIDGQQRLTALMAALLGQEVLTKDYKQKRIRIAFHPQREEFEVYNSAIGKDLSWIPDVATVFADDTSLVELSDDYTEKNPNADRRQISLTLENLRKIHTNSVGIIDLAEDLDIDTVTEIFIRVNSAGTELSQADFAMSKIAVNERMNGHILRKAIDYFCHLAIAPEFYRHIEKNDTEFAASEFLPKMAWLKDVNDDLYDPTYTDMLRVAFTSQFGRGRLQDLVALLSGRNFETKQYEEAVAEDAFSRLRAGVLDFINKTHFDRLTMILRSTGFLTSSLIRSRNAVNFAYILYLRSRAKGLPPAEIERVVRRWYSMTVLTGRYSGSAESMFDTDIRQLESEGPTAYVDRVIESELPDSFWTGMLPQAMETSSSTSPNFLVYQAAQVRLGDKGFLSNNITVRDLLLNRGDKHHLYPRKYLQQMGLTPKRYNQLANFVVAQSEINIAISAKAPELYFGELAEQCNGGPLRYGAITSKEEMRENLRMHCVPERMLDGEIPVYDDFLEERRRLMALKIKHWFGVLSGDSPSPVLEHVPTCNNTVNKTIRPEKILSESVKAQIEFWVQFGNYLEEHGLPFKAPKPSQSNWMQWGIGRSGVGLDVIANKTETLVMVEVNTRDHPDWFDELHSNKESIEATLGFALEWCERPDRKFSQIKVATTANKRLTVPRTELFEWITQHMDALDRVFRPKIALL